MDEVHNVNRQATQELDTYKKALAEREEEIAAMRKAGQQLLLDKNQLENLVELQDKLIEDGKPKE